MVGGGVPGTFSPFIDAATTRSPSTRATSASVASRAISRRIDRVVAQRLRRRASRCGRSRTSRSRRCLIGENVNIVKRSRSSACEMYWKPRLTSPTTYSSGTNTSSMNTSFVRSSPIVQMPWIVTPGWSSGTSISVMPAVLVVGIGAGAEPVPLGEVRGGGPRLLAVEDPAGLPSRSPRSALSRIDAASEPALGSL